MSATSATLVQHSPDVGLMSLLFNGWPSIIVLSIYVGLQLAKHIFNVGLLFRTLTLTVMYNYPRMGLNASCFFGVQKKNKRHITGISLTSFIESRFGTGIASGGPALQTLGQQ